MRALTILVAVLAALWSGWWVVGRAGVQAALQRVPGAAAAQGWEVAWSEASTAGFPNRFDTRLEEPRAVAPGGDLEWAAPFLDVLMLSYRPDHAIVAFPPRQTVTLAGLPIVIGSERMRASVVVGPALPPVLERATLEGEGLTVETLGTVATAARAQAATRWSADGAGYDLALTVAEVVIPEPAASMMAEGGLPPVVESLRMDAAARMDRRIDLGGAPPQVAGFDIRDAALVWGDVRLTAVGALEIDRAGRAQGLVTVRAEGWGRLLDLAASQNLLTPAASAIAEAALRGMATGEGDAVEVPLAVRDGVVRFGPLELARLPALL